MKKGYHTSYPNFFNSTDHAKEKSYDNLNKNSLNNTTLDYHCQNLTSKVFGVKFWYNPPSILVKLNVSLVILKIFIFYERYPHKNWFLKYTPAIIFLAEWCKNLNFLEKFVGKRFGLLPSSCRNKFCQIFHQIPTVQTFSWILFKINWQKK